MSNRYLLLAIAGLAGAAALGCTAVLPPAFSASPTPSPTAGAPASPAAVSFKGDVVPILKQHCAACHSTGGGGAGAVEMFDAQGEARHGAIAAEIGRMLQAIESGRMPLGRPGSVPEASIQKLKQWKDAGALAQ